MSLPGQDLAGHVLTKLIPTLQLEKVAGKRKTGDLTRSDMESASVSMKLEQQDKS